MKTVLSGFLCTLVAGLWLAGILAPDIDASPPSDEVGPTGAWSLHQIEDLRRRAMDEHTAYLSFLNEDTLSAGVYRLPAGGVDQQTPHELDEVYYVAEGRATFLVDGDATAVGPGSILFVRAGVDHRFRDIREDLTVLVLFSKKAPAAPEPAEEEER